MNKVKIQRSPRAGWWLESLFGILTHYARDIVYELSGQFMYTNINTFWSAGLNLSSNMILQDGRFWKI